MGAHPAPTATYRVQHRTAFNYSADVSLSQQMLRLTPRQTERQRVVGSTILVEPSPIVRETGTDFFGNTTTFLSIQEPHRRLTIQASSTVTVTPFEAPPLADSTPWEQVAANLRAPNGNIELQASGFCFASPHIDIPDSVTELIDDIFKPQRPILDATMALTTRIYESFTYKGGVTDVRTPVSSVLKKRQGVCQDFAHLQIACLRYLGLSARYVSGYLLTQPPPGKARLVGADESHAWLAVWSARSGWVEFDPTNNLIPRSHHVVLGWGRDYADVSPVNGFIVGGGKHELAVSVDVMPLR